MKLKLFIKWRHSLFAICLLLGGSLSMLQAQEFHHYSKFLMNYHYDNTFGWWHDADFTSQQTHLVVNENAGYIQIEKVNVSKRTFYIKQIGHLEDGSIVYECNDAYSVPCFVVITKTGKDSWEWNLQYNNKSKEIFYVYLH